MFKILKTLVLLVLLSFLVPPHASAGTDISSINFSDDNLRQCIEEATHYPPSNTDQVHILTCDSKNIQSLGGIEFFTKLFHLDLSNNAISDISPLNILPARLDTLILANNNISNFNLANDHFYTLKVLDLSNNALPSTINLSNMYFGNLEELNLSHNNIEYLNDIGDLGRLKRLDLSHNQYRYFEIGGLPHLENLEYLSFAHNHINYIQDLPIINRHGQAEGTLNLSNNLFEVLPNLNRLGNQVSHLDFSNNPSLREISSLVDLSSRFGQPNLKTLNLSGTNNLTCNDLNRAWAIIPNDAEFIRPTICTGSTMPIDFNALGMTDFDLRWCIVEQALINPNWASIDDIETLHCKNVSTLSGPHVENVLEGINNLTRLKTLRLESSYIDSISPLIGLNMLEILILENDHYDFTDLSPLAFLPKLKAVEIDAASISNIAPLINHRNITSFEWVNLYRSDSVFCAQLDTLEGILNTPETPFAFNRPNNCSEDNRLIESLSFADANLKTCVNNNAILNGWTKANEVWNLACHDEDISNISGLEAFYNLIVISMHRNNISDLSPLQSLGKLETIGFEDNNISDITPLKVLWRMKNIYASNNNISDLTTLSDLNQLQYLNLTNNNITSIAPLASSTDLLGLFLSGNNISDISAIFDLINLEYLFLNRNNISDVAHYFLFLTSLEMLEMYDNNISDINSIIVLENLKHLSLAGNNISSLYDMSRLSSLVSLSLKNNQITDISNLQGMTSLQALYLSINQIDNIESLHSLYNLQYLSIYSNPSLTCDDINNLSASISNLVINSNACP